MFNLTNKFIYSKCIQNENKSTRVTCSLVYVYYSENNLNNII